MLALVEDERDPVRGQALEIVGALAMAEGRWSDAIATLEALSADEAFDDERRSDFLVAARRHPRAALRRFGDGAYAVRSRARAVAGESVAVARDGIIQNLTRSKPGRNPSRVTSAAMRTKLRSVVTIGLLLGTLLFSSVIGGCSSDDNKTGTGGTSGGGGTGGAAGTTGAGGERCGRRATAARAAAGGTGGGAGGGGAGG